jgi:hypothetical protein
VNQKETLNMSPPFMKGWLEIITNEHKFKKFDADARWNKSKSKMLVVGVDVSDVDAVSTITGTAKKTMSNRKVVDLELNKWKLRFRESHKKGGSKAPDAKTTEKQEKGSKFVFEYVLGKKSGYPNLQAFKSDQKMMDGLKKIYPDVDDDWLDVFYKQHKVILDKFAGSQITKFDHSGDGSFMNVITEIVTKNFKIPKKDNWNPADIWGVRGSSKDVIIKVEQAVYGSRDSQTIQQLNALMRGMYKAKELVGISLKKTSGKEAKWEEYNIEALTLSEVNDYKYNQIDIIYNLKATAATQALDTAVQLRQSGGGAEYNFQITSNDTSKGSQNLKFESKPIGSSKARGGKAEIKAVEALLVDNSVGGFRNKHQNYPKNFDEFTKQTIDGKDLKSYKMMFNSIRTKVSSDCKDGDEFEEVIGKIFTGSKPWVAQSKLMQLTFLDHALKITDKRKYTEFWTDMLFLSIKKGDRFGPFGKLY